MNLPSILVFLGGLFALAGPLALPFVDVDGAGVRLDALDLWPGRLALLLGLALLVAARGLAIGHRRAPGVALAAALSLVVDLGAAWWFVWDVVPCRTLGLGACDAASGGLVAGTLVTFGAGAALALTGAGLALLGTFALWTAPRAIDPQARFLRLLLTWDGALLAERLLLVPRPVTVGEADDATVQLAATGLHRHALFVPVPGDEYRLEVPRGVDGVLWLHGEERRAQGVDAVQVGRGDAGRLRFDNGLELAFQFSAAATGRLPGALGFDPRLAVSLASVASLFALAITALLLDGRSRPRVEVDEDVAERPPIVIALQEQETPPPDEPPPIEPEGLDPEPTSKRAEGEEGRIGEPDRDPRLVPKVARRDVPLATKVDPGKAGLAGVLADAKHEPGALATILAGDTGAITSRMPVAAAGPDEADVAGHGPGGLGWRGTGHGGGGPDGPPRIRGLGTIDTGLSDGRTADLGRRQLGRKRRKAVDPVLAAPAASIGGCERGDIAKAVRSRAAAIRVCYESRLMSRPELQGKLTLQWTIDAEGRADGLKAVEDTLDDAIVTDCVRRALRTAHFTAPEAGVCVVRYPFVFSAP